MTGRAGLLLAGPWFTAAVWAAEARDTAGPAMPVEDRVTPAQRVIDRYAVVNGPRRPARPCREPDGEIVVCAPAPGEGSPYILPLPDERGPRPGPRTATGEMPRGSLDTSGMPPCCGGDPSRSHETFTRIIKAVKGEDPD